MEPVVSIPVAFAILWMILQSSGKKAKSKSQFQDKEGDW